MKNLFLIDNNENLGYFVISKDSFESTNLADCYDRYGQEIGHYYAGDYSLYNNESSAQIDCIEEIGKAFPHIKDEPIEFDGDFVRINDEQMDWFEDDDEISSFIKKWEEENSNYEQVEAHTYWNGHNWQSIIVEAEYSDGACTHQVIYSEDLLQELEEALKNMEYSKSARGVELYRYGKYLIHQSQWQGTWEDYRITEEE